MPKAKPKQATQPSEIAQLTENMKGVIEVVSNLSKDVASLREEVEVVKTRPQQPQPITGLKPINQLPTEPQQDVASRFPNMGAVNQTSKMPDYLPVDEIPIAFTQVKNEILGEQFEMKMEEMTDRAEYRVSIIVPDNYRLQEEIQKYQAHHEKKRADYQNELTRKNENITQEEIDKKMKAWDEVNDTVNVPKDTRTKNISKVAGLGINQFREWLTKIKENLLKNQQQPLQDQSQVLGMK